MGVRILHAADTHLGRAFSQLGARASERQRDVLDTFEHLCRVAVERQVAALIFAGDLFDTYDPRALVGYVQGQIDRLASRGIRAFIIPGNHDDVWYPGSVWREKSFPGAHVFCEATFSKVSFDADGVTFHVHGVAYNNTICAEPLPTLVREAGGVNIALMHATVDPPSGFPIEQRYFPLTHEVLAASGMDYVGLGHIHKQRTFKRDGRVIGCYPGSPEGLDPTETGSRHIALIHFDGGPPNLELVQVNKRTVLQESLDVTSCTLHQVAERLKLKGSHNLLLTTKLTGAPAEVLDVDELRNRLGDLFFWLDVDDATEMVEAQWVEDISRENTIRGEFVRSLRERIEAARDRDTRATLEVALKLGLVALQKRSAS